MIKDLSGTTFGKWNVIKLHDTKNGKTIWVCECTCGNIKNVYRSNLISGRSTQCKECKNKNMDSSIDETGNTYGKLTVVGKSKNTWKNGFLLWECACACGNTVHTSGSMLRNRNTRSCKSCALNERKPYKHKVVHKRIYTAWQSMVARCHNPRKSGYELYGKRGIVVCKEWKNSFDNFYDWAMENGYEDHLSIDRIDVDGNYEPSNCRWVTTKEQNNNKRNTVYITHNGETKPLSEWAEELSIRASTIHTRYSNGIRSSDELLKIPPENKKSGIKGVVWDTKKEKWCADFIKDGKRHRVCRFTSVSDALEFKIKQIKG